MCFLVALWLLPTPALPQPSKPSDLAPRRAAEKPAKTRVGPDRDAARVIVKFSEGTRVRRGARGLEGAASFEPGRLRAVLARHGLAPDALRRLLQLPESRVDALRELGQVRSRRALADMNLYFRLDVPAGVDTAALCDELNALPFVELAEPEARPMPAPVDLPPPTPDFSAQQYYRDPPPAGIGVPDPALVPGGDGSGITIVDIEYSWRFDHEDLELPPAAMLDIGTPVDPFSNPEHGTAVLGELGALGNGYGMSGAVRGVTLRVAPAFTSQSGYSVALAITQSAAVLGPGDVILLEQQACVCGRTCSPSCSGCGPVEWEQANFDAIALATSLGISVIEAAGNGSVQLDAPACLGRFDRSVRDSGAIIVGAGNAFHRRLFFSSHGSRVDLQAWGQNVATTGYGDLFNPGDARQRYTSGFSGTSSASPIVAAAAASVQGALVAAGSDPLDPVSLRTLLALTGEPQDACEPPAEKIGPFPNVPAALGLAEPAGPPPQCDDGLDNDADGRSDLADGDCTHAGDPSEWSLRPGDVLIADSGPFDDRPGGSGQLLRVDPVSGFQTVLADPREVSDPTALALRPDGRLLGLDFSPARVFEIDPASPGVSLLGGCGSRAWGFATEAAGTIVFTDTVNASVQRFDPVSGAQSTVSSGGALVVPRGIQVEGGGSLVLVDGVVSPNIKLLRISPDTGMQTLLSANGLLSQPRGLALEADGSLVVANLGLVVRVDAESGAQSLVASGGNLAALGGIDVDDCTGDLFTAEQGITGATPALVRIHPASGAQSVISTGDRFVEPVGVSLVRGACAQVPVAGSALGGSVGVMIGEVLVSVPTLAGQPLQQILTWLATAIRNHPTLESLGIAATVSGGKLQVRGGAQVVSFVSNDPGLRPVTPPSGVPALSAQGLAALAGLLAAGGVLAWRSSSRAESDA
jgi:sugar lactone lactonase YvrE